MVHMPEIASKYIGRFAIAMVKHNPKIVLQQIEQLFAVAMKPITLEEFKKGVETKQDLIKDIPQADFEQLIAILRSAEARDIYKTAIKPAITGDLILIWLLKYKREIWAYCVNTRVNPVDDKVKSKAELYIIDEYMKGVKEVDRMCADLDSVENSKEPVYRAVERKDKDRGPMPA